MADLASQQLLTHATRLMVYGLDDARINASLKRFAPILAPSINVGIEAFLAQIVKTPRVGEPFAANRREISALLTTHFTRLLMDWRAEAHEERNHETVECLRGFGADMRALYATASHIYDAIAMGATSRIGFVSKIVVIDLAIIQRFLAFDAATALAAAQIEAVKRAEDRTTHILEEVDKFRTGAGHIALELAEASDAVDLSVVGVQKAANSALEKSSRAAEASEQGTNNLTASATSTEELSMATSELARRAESARAAVNDAEVAVAAARGSISDLQSAADKIGSIVGLISSIAEQTNLLALNATIEAARAGDAGRGFAVVAQEVKALASQTTRATQDIIAQIAAVQDGTARSVHEIGSIGVAMETLSHNASEVASAVDQQNALTGELARSLHETVVEVMAAGEGYEGAAQLMQTTNLNIGTLRTTVERMRSISDGLGRDVESFAAAVRAA
jgi:methyl-accepting chemotaxis protein